MNAREYAAAFMREYPKKDGMDAAGVEAAITAVAPLPPWEEMGRRLAAFRSECVKMGTLDADGTPCERTRYIPNAANWIARREWEKYDAAPPTKSVPLLPSGGDILNGTTGDFIRLCQTFGVDAMRRAIAAAVPEYAAAWDAIRDAQRAGRLGSLAACPLPLKCALARKRYAADETVRGGDLAAGWYPSRYIDRLCGTLTPQQRDAVEAHKAAGWDEWHDALAAAGC